MTAPAEKIVSVMKIADVVRTATAMRIANVVTNVIAEMIANVMKITNVMTIALAKAVTAKSMKKSVTTNIINTKRTKSLNI